MIARISVNSKKMKIRVIFRSTSKIFHTKFIFDCNQQFSRIFQIRTHFFQKCLIRSISLSETHGIFQHAVDYHIIILLSKLHIIQIPYHDRKVILFFIPIIINLCSSFRKLYGSYFSGFFTQHSCNRTASCTNFQHTVRFCDWVPVQYICTQIRKMIDYRERNLLTGKSLTGCSFFCHL